eukprot:5770270-Pleurochrysis_carterae.AAC.1
MLQLAQLLEERLVLGAQALQTLRPTGSGQQVALARAVAPLIRPPSLLVPRPCPTASSSCPSSSPNRFLFLSLVLAQPLPLPVPRPRPCLPPCPDHSPLPDPAPGGNRQFREAYRNAMLMRARVQRTRLCLLRRAHANRG